MTHDDLDTAWDISLPQLNHQLRLAGVDPVPEEPGVRSARDLDAKVRLARIEALRRSVAQARRDAPPVRDWTTAAEALILEDDGSAAAQARADVFWMSLSLTVYGCLALVMLGDVSEFPFFVELLRSEPAGHLAELATDVLSHTVDPEGKLARPELVQRAQEWWQQTRPSPGALENG